MLRSKHNEIFFCLRFTFLFSVELMMIAQYERALLESFVFL